MKKGLRDLAIMAFILIILYTTGLHTEVAAFTQRLVLNTGLVSSSLELKPEDIKEADYNLALRDIKGKETNLSEFKGKVIFLNVWATWCPPCVAEMPGIQALYEKMEGSDVAFVMLSMDRDTAKPERFIKKKGFTFPVYLPAGPMPEVFKSPSIPTTFVISPEGKIISKKVGMANYDTKSFQKFLLKHTESTN